MSTTAPDAAVTDSVPPPRNAWWTVAVLTILYWFGTLDRQVSALLVPQIKSGLQLSDFQLSMITGVAFGVTYVLASPITGWFVDRYSRRKVLFFGAVGWSLSAVSSGFARTFGQLFGARAGVGGFESTLNPTSYSILSDLFPPGKLALPMSVYVMGGNLGSGMSFLAGGAVIAWIASMPALTLPVVGELADWQMAFILTGVPGLLLAPLALFANDARRIAPTVKRSTAGFADLWRHMRRYPGFFLSHNLGFACVQALIVGLQSWNAAYISRSFGWPVSKIGFALGGIQIITALSGLALHGWLVDRLFSRGRKDAHMHYFMVMMLLALPCAVAAYTVRSAYGMILLYNLAYLFVMAGASVGPAALQMAIPENLRGKASAIYMVVLTFIGVILGPVFVASVTTFVFGDEAKLGQAMALFSLVACTVAAVLFAVGRPRMRKIVADMVHA